MKKLAEKALVAKAKALFKDHPKQTKCVMTQDGNGFVGGSALNYAKAHAKQWKLKFYEVEKGKEAEAFKPENSKTEK